MRIAEEPKLNWSYQLASTHIVKKNMNQVYMSTVLENTILKTNNYNHTNKKNNLNASHKYLIILNNLNGMNQERPRELEPFLSKQILRSHAFANFHQNRPFPRYSLVTTIRLHFRLEILIICVT